MEGADVAGGKVSDLVLADDAPLTTEFRSDLLGGVEVITGEAQRQVMRWHSRRFPTTRGRIAAKGRWPCGCRGQQTLSRNRRTKKPTNFIGGPQQNNAALPWKARGVLSQLEA